MCRHCSTAAKVSRSLPASILECILEQGYMTLDEEEWHSLLTNTLWLPTCLQVG